MLMPGGNRKKAITLIINSMKPDRRERMGGGRESGVFMPEEPESDYELALMDAGRKVISALEQKDVRGFVDYMKEMIYMCQEDSNDEDEYPMG